jgi:transcriptional regulator with XRE-family HTH domain
MTPSKEIGAIIKDRRKTKKLSQKQLSEKIFGDDNHNASISRIEKGEWKNSNFITIYNILNALDIELISLIKNA